MTISSAEALALKALAWLIDSPSALDRFLAETGANAAIMREAAGDPQFLSAVVDFLLADDSLLTAFCENEGTEPKAVHLARHTLSGAPSGK